MKPSIFDVANKSGLSVVTVSRVLNGSGNVRERNRLRVLAAMKELDYRPNAAAQSLAKGKTGVIGLLISTLQDSVFDAIVKEVHDELAEHGYFLALSVSPSDREPGSSFLMEKDRVDGIIVLSPTWEDTLVPELQQKEIPYVIIDNQNPAYDKSAIEVGHYSGGYAAGQHLVELGHTSIAHLSGPAAYKSTIDRMNGFLKALADSGLDPLFIEEGPYSMETGYNAAKRWINEDRLPEAVFCGDDYIAVGVLNALQEAGLSVPRHLSLVGYDDQNLATLFRPMLTTVAQPVLPIARSAVKALLAQLEGKPSPEPVVLQPELIVRQSTALSQSFSKESPL
ncbi:LacI family DNA-binding transcriptional regulator [Paenibacillus herberti]|uniref:LacI family transcriptional regulator n=1 Tax=Paenibacillus herberti TaxID=1619309 RepID=A0A229P4M7_9BACL|nr:LacI family DNA-binding transcriptional regulator [Paenibacillus herberti]OXM16875.1 LacI family transcriptional regulator [Paenibacillus herberti]